ncbi:putative helicase mov-10-B.1 [Choristoneura fumiferana]|uniref:putative helicase mov-10-B.1 n=1 Tax=Choristoneura fumiferana TaxID=7141 RepID=UPI003D1544E4
MSSRCVICSEDNVPAGHEGTKKHLKNAGLLELEKYKKKFSENRDGINVICSVIPTAYNAEPLLTDKEQCRLEVSVRPQVEIRLTFTLRNDNPHEIIFGGIVMLNKKRTLNFTLHNKNVDVPCAHTIQPEQKFKEQVSITFESQTIGVYQMSIYFFFLAVGNDQPIVIYKEIVVFVKRENNLKRRVNNPYTQEVVSAERVVSSLAAQRKIQINKYQIPSKNDEDYKTVFNYLEQQRLNKIGANGRLSTDAQNTLLENIRLIYETGPIHNNYIQYFRHLLWCEEVSIANNMKNYNMLGVPLLPFGQWANSFALTVPGLAEKRPCIMPGDFVHVRPHGQKKILFESLITDIQDTCAVFGEFATEFKRYFVPGAKFDIRFFMSRVPLERMHEAVSDVQSSFATSKIFPQKTNPPRVNVIPDDQFFNKQVAANPEQRSIVEHVVGGSSGTAPYLVLGPPGTGKTVTIVEAILQLARDPNNRILVCTDSNMAADHVASKLVRYRKLFSDKEFILRANSEFRPWEEMPKVLEPYSNGSKRANWSPVKIKRFLNHRIVITTLIHAAKFARELKYKKYDRNTTHIFIDEAAQASEPAALVPVCGLLTPGGALVLAGDPRQLGPFCVSREAKAQGLGVSLMERLKNKCDLYSDENPDPNFFMKLKTNFRSHADILSIPNELFYNGELKSQAQRDRISVKDILGQKELSRAIIFHGVLSREQREGKSPSFFNDIEVEIVKSYAEALVNQHKVPQKEIGVITPYIMQVDRIMYSLDKVRLAKIDVGTVEAFQGREKRVIILSCVRANCDLFGHDAKFQLGFLDSAQRFNVAITRAKAKLIVIGNPLCLRNDAKWLKYMQKCRKFNTYTGFDCGVETDADLEEVLQQIAPIMAMIKKITASKE